MSNDKSAAWQRALVGAEATVRSAMEAIAASRRHICIVTDADRHLLGTITDGDIRRALLRGVTLDEPVSTVMVSAPVTAAEGTPRNVLAAMMVKRGIREIPIVAADGTVTGIHSLNPHPEEQAVRDNWVVLMAGGQGRRLRPFTDNTPKPMLEVGAQPILETILGQVMLHGFRRFFISVNYMADAIIEHFGDGSAFGAQIQYLREDRPLGTAGSLALIDRPIDKPLIAINGDVLNQLNFSSLLQYHHDHGCAATMCVRDSEFQVPFGIVSIDNGAITGIVEKPSQRHFVNAGIYVLGPDALAAIEPDTRLDMPDLFNRLIAGGRKTMAFPIGEYWTDVGRPEDLAQADKDFRNTFQLSTNAAKPT